MTTKIVDRELDALKDKARQMGIQFHPGIGLAKLQARVDAAPAATPPVFKEPEKAEHVVPFEDYVETRAEKSIRLRKEANRLIRIKATCMNPNKKAWEGEIFSISNATIGTIKKFVPFNTDAGYHVPHVIYQHMKNRKYQHFVKVKLDNGRSTMKSVLSNEFSIEVMDPLTSEELKELANRQALNHSID